MRKGTHKVEFKAHHPVTKKMPVKFTTKEGDRVSFKAKKTVKKPVKVKFQAKN